MDPTPPSDYTPPPHSLSCHYFQIIRRAHSADGGSESDTHQDGRFGGWTGDDIRAQQYHFQLLDDHFCPDTFSNHPKLTACDY